MNRYVITAAHLYSSVLFEKSKYIFKAFSPDPFRLSLNFSKLKDFRGFFLLDIDALLCYI